MEIEPVAWMDDDGSVFSEAEREISVITLKRMGCHPLYSAATVEQLVRDRDQYKYQADEAGFERVRYGQRLATVEKERDELSKVHADLTKMYNLLAEDRVTLIKERDALRMMVTSDSVDAAGYEALLKQYRETLEYHQEQTRPIQRTMDLLAQQPKTRAEHESAPDPL